MAAHPSHDLGNGAVEVRSVGKVTAEYWVKVCRGCGAEALSRIGLGFVGRDARKLSKPCPTPHGSATAPFSEDDASKRSDG